MIEINKIYNMDCIEGMKLIEDKSIDLILTDPPYNIGLIYGDKYNDLREDYLDWCKKWFYECKRISNNIIFTCGPQNLKMWLLQIEYPKLIGIWHVPNQCSGFGGGFNHYEPILIYGDVILNKNAFMHYITIQKEIGNHPCPKPLSLYYEIIKNCRKEYNIILDPFSGSGTTLLAAIQLNRKFIGFEINKEYCNITINRINNYKNQMRF